MTYQYAFYAVNTLILYVGLLYIAALVLIYTHQRCIEKYEDLFEPVQTTYRRHDPHLGSHKISRD